MMLELTPDARLRLNLYLEELRRVLAACGTVNPADVERDVQDHIDAALSERPGPIDKPVLDEVLETLGRPQEWVPEGAAAVSTRTWPEFWQQNRERLWAAWLELMGGPESYRLAYLAFLTPLLAWMAVGLAGDDDMIAVGIVGTIAGFVFARAALASFGADRLSAGQKWLLYPPLLLVDVPLVAGLVLLPFLFAPLVWDVLDDGDVPRRPFTLAVPAKDRELLALTLEVDRLRKSLGPAHPDVQAAEERLREALERDRLVVMTPRDALRTTNFSRPSAWTPQEMLCAVAALTGTWWLLLGLAAWLKAGWVRAVLAPFAAGYRGRFGLALAAVGLLLGGVCLAFVA